MKLYRCRREYLAELVALLVSAWIEMDVEWTIAGGDPVALLVSAWIEISES